MLRSGCSCDHQRRLNHARALEAAFWSRDHLGGGLVAAPVYHFAILEKHRVSPIIDARYSVDALPEIN